MMKRSLINKALKTHCYDGFPRKIGFPNQSMCYGIRELRRHFWQYNGSAKGVYTSVFPESIKESRKFNKFYFDIDSKEPHGIEELDQACVEAMTLHLLIKRYFEVEPRVYFSGMKGFALYLDTNFDYQYKKYRVVFQRLVDFFVKEEGLELLDRSVVGDVGRISRLPFSIHKKSGQMCIPIDFYDYYLELIIEHSRVYNGNYEIKIQPALKDTEGFEMIKHWDETAEEYLKEQMAQVETNGWGGNVNLDLLMRKADKLQGYREVLMYRVIIPQMLIRGKSENEVHDYCEAFSQRSGFDRDFRRVINYQIRRFQQKKYHPLSNKRLLYEYPELRRILYGK